MHRDDAQHFLRFGRLTVFLIGVFALLGMVVALGPGMGLVLADTTVAGAATELPGTLLTCGDTLERQTVTDIQGAVRPAYIELDGKRYFKDSFTAHGLVEEVRGNCERGYVVIA
ncbi:MAG: hypothetical protein OXR66_06910 [Candidatus Woesearchaeota archaeon]|nr:hypothetical protein [Candidatus Woesearchaeota archaeon]